MASAISPRDMESFGLKLSPAMLSRRLYLSANSAYLCDQWFDAISDQFFATVSDICSPLASANMAKNSTRVTSRFGSKNGLSVVTIFLFTASDTRGFTQCCAGTSRKIQTSNSPCCSILRDFNTIARSSERIIVFSLLNVPSP